MEKPPVIQPPKSLRFAATLNFIVPGAGQFYLGRRLVGCVLGIIFLTCLVSMLTVFLKGYSDYLSAALSNDILKGQQIEKMGDVFHTRWQIGLLITAVVIYIGSFVGLPASRRS